MIITLILLSIFPVLKKNQYSWEICYFEDRVLIKLNFASILSKYETSAQIIEKRYFICSSSREKALATFWVIEKDALFDSRINLSAALLKIIRIVTILNHAWIISFIELDASPTYVIRFKIYGPGIFSQRGTEGKFIQRKIQDTWATKSQQCYCWISKKLSQYW